MTSSTDPLLMNLAALSGLFQDIYIMFLIMRGLQSLEQLDSLLHTKDRWRGIIRGAVEEIEQRMRLRAL